MKQALKNNKIISLLYYKIRNIFLFARKLLRLFYFYPYPTAKIFLYHRVADVKNDPNFLCVETENFSNQLIYLKENFNIIKLSELVEKIKNQTLDKKDISITFDDGYADNLINALSILEKLNIPATIFITAGKISDLTPFDWDKNTDELSRGRALTKDELITLSQSQYIEIGAHTVNHPHLSSLNLNEQTKEITESQIILETIINKKIIGFSYPFGEKKDFDAQSIAITKSCFAYACANTPKRISRKSDIFALPRFIIRNWEIKKFKKELRYF